ncbi:hypothetical protein GE21DRAFT_9876 [Neurospora crassa]|uniref:Uncharacterized protein n=1 Tax=Neurospora crassa (strain ATCC 24698 / 74-OR23-1A / CBS 708.71 / DSM 1257 / FGSC 987) TaxID=367110 RepID=Q7S4L2_NEUCR|nr:hypothetical protein NCU09588 [Neurospora crassa OR74A]EAA30463.3 hypothetical protein NCU09588 [Neurospora crassa OR74A]KHE81530.1 hypothetical protein GE21DRAFT_9876 [Neurospora crassa]|eukprot:XP_959699.3 hypothetical protein NCU09588 [Neurospora crassa OR74A]
MVKRFDGAFDDGVINALAQVGTLDSRDGFERVATAAVVVVFRHSFANAVVREQVHDHGFLVRGQMIADSLLDDRQQCIVGLFSLGFAVESCTDSHCYTGSERHALARGIVQASKLDTKDKLIEMTLALCGYIDNLRKTYWKARDAEELFTVQRRERLAIELLGFIKGMNLGT